MIERYEPKKNQPSYQAVMNVILQANPEEAEVERKMCDALRKLFAEDFKNAENHGLELGQQQGENRLGQLTLLLLNNNLYDEAKKASSDSNYRKKLYKQYNIA